MAASQLSPPVHAPFDSIAESYDKIFTDSLIGRAQRDAVWQELDRVFHSGQRVLELNCGTGVDAVFLAERGVSVVACDVAPRMIEVARRRVSSAGMGGLVDFRILATEDIAVLAGEGPFDGAFSNFAGLNCVEDLSAVARSLAWLLKPGARVLLCMAGRFVAWEIAWYLAQGNLHKALRRFRRSGAVGRLPNGATVKVYYASVGVVSRVFAPEFHLRKWKGVGLIVPPSYLEPLAQRFAKVLDKLVTADRWLGRFPVLRAMADHVLLEFERAEG